MSEISQSPEKSALVLFSGGQDSATCLAWALERFDRVETVGADIFSLWRAAPARELEAHGESGVPAVKS